jgi:hypothetical protein
MHSNEHLSYRILLFIIFYKSGGLTSDGVAVARGASGGGAR